jgi:hypothetical protein
MNAAFHKPMITRDILDCGGKRSATPLFHTPRAQKIATPHNQENQKP